VTIGFTGLGIMGKPMAANLMKARNRLVVYDVAQERLAQALADGAEQGASPADVASRCDIVITMLPNSPQVREVALPVDGGMTAG
jgi:2-hydroxy-3-oxopropionate reductase